MALEYKIVITPDAQECIRQITEYLVQNVSLETAIKVNQAIIDTINSLKTFPERNEIAENISKRGIVFRRIMAMSYRIVYTVDKEKIQVVIVDVDYGPRNPQRLIHKLG